MIKGIIGLILAVILIALFKWVGVIILVVLCALYLLVGSKRDPEIDSLRSSLTIMREEIEDTLDAYDFFAYSNNADAIADRTLHRPELLNRNSCHSAIGDFHREAEAAKRFLQRLTVRLNNDDLGVGPLEELLNLADAHEQRLRNAWGEARAAARDIGREQ